MLVLADVEGGEGAVDAARGDDRDLARERHEAFEDGREVADRLIGLGEVAARARS